VRARLARQQAQLTLWQYADQQASDYEEDHLVSLELGGAPRSKKNPLAAAVVTGPPRRQRDRGPPSPPGLQRDADASAGAATRGRLQAQVRL